MREGSHTCWFIKRKKLAGQSAWAVDRKEGGYVGHVDVSLGRARHLRLPGGVSHSPRELGSYGRTVSWDGHTQA